MSALVSGGMEVTASVKGSERIGGMAGMLRIGMVGIWYVLRSRISDTCLE